MPLPAFSLVQGIEGQYLTLIDMFLYCGMSDRAPVRKWELDAVSLTC